MRADMHEVVIERPRGGMRGKLPQPRFDGRHWHDDEVPASRASMSKSRGTKHFSDLLGPLRRFLLGAVGRPWDGVYSEIREHLSPDKRLHRHILDHVAQMVQVHLPVRDAHWRPELWVCPRTGLLRHSRRQSAAVTTRRYLTRRVGEPWAAVLRESGDTLPALARWVTLAVARRFGHRGRIHEWVEATAERAGHLGNVLPRGRLYVESGVLRIVR